MFVEWILKCLFYEWYVIRYCIWFFWGSGLWSKENVIKVCVLEGFFDFEYLNDRIIKLKFLEVEKSNKLLKVINIFRK